MDLATLRTGVHTLILDARRLERIIVNPEFEALFSTLTDGDKAHVSVLVKDLQIDKLVKFIQTKAELQIGEMSVRQLRAKASAMCISGYSLMSKESLIRAILQEQARVRSRSGQAVGVESRTGVLFEQGQAGAKGPGKVSPVSDRLLAISC